MCPRVKNQRVLSKARAGYAVGLPCPIHCSRNTSKNSRTARRNWWSIILHEQWISLYSTSTFCNS